MADHRRVLGASSITGRGASLNPFVIINDAAGFIDFATAVFGAAEVAEARTGTPAGLLIHAEVRIGDSLLLLSDPQHGWAARPGLFQLWVSDIRSVLDASAGYGAKVITPPTPFYGAVTLARMQDRWKNLWWLYEPAPGQEDPQPAWEGGSDVVFRTIDQYMRDRSTEVTGAPEDHP